MLYPDSSDTKASSETDDVIRRILKDVARGGEIPLTTVETAKGVVSIIRASRYMISLTDLHVDYDVNPIEMQDALNIVCDASDKESAWKADLLGGVSQQTSLVATHADICAGSTRSPSFRSEHVVD